MYLDPSGLKTERRGDMKKRANFCSSQSKSKYLLIFTPLILLAGDTGAVQVSPEALKDLNRIQAAMKNGHLDIAGLADLNGVSLEIFTKPDNAISDELKEQVKNKYAGYLRTAKVKVSTSGTDDDGIMCPTLALMIEKYPLDDGRSLLHVKLRLSDFVQSRRNPERLILAHLWESTRTCVCTDATYYLQLNDFCNKAYFMFATDYTGAYVLRLSETR